MSEEAVGVLSEAPPASSVQPASQPEGVEAASPAEIVAPEKQFADTVEALESGKSPTEAAKESEAKPEAKPKDEGKVEDKATDAEVLLKSQQEEALNKKFDERPEWKKALSLVPKAQQHEMRTLMREVLQREQAVNQQVEQFKPAVQKFERFRKSVGDDQAVENTIQLTEMFQRGDPKAREMLVTLLNDLDARTGTVLTSPDLKKRSEAIDQKVTDGLMEAADAETARKDLLEIQKARVGQQQTESQKQAAQRQQMQQGFERQQAEMVGACNDWEKDKMASDPDYPSLKAVVESRAFLIGNEKQNKLQGRLLNATEMKSVLEEALTWAKAEAVKFAPRPQARTRLNGGGSSATSRRAPANDEEAFNQEIERLEAKRR